MITSSFRGAIVVVAPPGVGQQFEFGLQFTLRTLTREIRVAAAAHPGASQQFEFDLQLELRTPARGQMLLSSVRRVGG